MKYARENGAQKHSPKNYRQALSLLRKADIFYERREYKKAQKNYYYAMRYFEKAEVRARLMNLKTGGGF